MSEVSELRRRAAVLLQEADTEDAATRQRIEARVAQQRPGDYDPVAPPLTRLWLQQGTRPPAGPLSKRWSKTSAHVIPIPEWEANHVGSDIHISPCDMMFDERVYYLKHPIEKLLRDAAMMRQQAERLLAMADKEEK